jgi:hypothetical protein
MCDVCRNEGMDRFFKNGPKKTDTFRQKLYNFFQDREAVVSLCHIHSYELFLIGEKKFVERHPLLVRDMIQEKKKYMTSSASSF